MAVSVITDALYKSIVSYKVKIDMLLVISAWHKDTSLHAIANACINPVKMIDQQQWARVIGMRPNVA